MRNHCLWRTDNSCSRNLSLPAKIEIFTQDFKAVIKPTEQTQEIVSHQGHSPGSYKDVSDEIMLSLVELTGLHSFNNRSKSIDTLPHMKED